MDLIIGSLTSGFIQHFVLAETSPTLWYLTRTFGVVAYVLLSLSIVCGLLRVIARRTSESLSWIIDELHQFLALLSGFAVLAHLVVLYYDPFLPFTLSNLILPFDEPYRPLPIRLGVISVYGIIILLLTSWLRQRINYQIWRFIHYTSFITFILVSLHGIYAGSDVNEPWIRAIYGCAVAAIGFLSIVRVFAGPSLQSAYERD
jgi:sulfoxide reductase heme-binding subunit YedZ